MRDGKMQAEHALHRLEDQHVGEVVLVELLANVGREVGGDLRLALLSDRQDAAQAIAGVLVVQPEMPGKHRRLLLAIGLNLELRIPCEGGHVGEVLEVPAEIDRRVARDDDRGLGRALLDEPVGLQLAQGLPDGDQADAEMLRDVRFLGKLAADDKVSVRDWLAQDVGELAVQRTVGAAKNALWKQSQIGDVLVHRAQDWRMPASMLSSAGAADYFKYSALTQLVSRPSAR